MTPSKKRLKLGTRRSLLATAQSQWVAREVERLNPDVTVELFFIDTQGDKIQDISLQKVEGKDFFVKELDEALLSGLVDFNVHSMKDLSLDRPEGLRIAAIPRREDPRDVIFFHEERTLARLRAGQPIRIGTSSPRRLENIPPLLTKLLPRLSEATPQLQLIEIRGNVNTRLSRVHEADESPKQLEGVVLALAGLQRLYNDHNGKTALTELFKGTCKMVLPLIDNPTAPAQGALAIECRSDAPEVMQALSKMHDPHTQRQVTREREVLLESGGGCHQRFGATCFGVESLGEVMSVAGVMQSAGGKAALKTSSSKSADRVERLEWEILAPPTSAKVSVLWDGSQVGSDQSAPEGGSMSVEKELIERASAFFVAHSRAVTDAVLDLIKNKVLWTSGLKSWQKLAEKGLWVEGCAEGLGYEWIEPTLRLSVLGERQWMALTHQDATQDWKIAVHATYQVSRQVDLKAAEALKQATHLYWSSGSQFERYAHSAQPQAQHACGPGKTARFLQKQGVNPTVFPNSKEWKKWLQTASS